MIEHRTLPLTYHSWDEGKGNLCVFYHSVIFTKNFGNIRMGDKIPLIHVDLEYGLMHRAEGRVDDAVLKELIGQFTCQHVTI